MMSNNNRLTIQEEDDDDLQSIGGDINREQRYTQEITSDLEFNDIQYEQ